MMNGKVRFVTAILAIALIAGMMTACTVKDDAVKENSETTASDSTETSASETAIPKPILPEFDYQEHVFNVLCLGNGVSATYDIYDVAAKEQNGDLINDAVYMRNLVIEDKYNITIADTKKLSAEITESVQKNVLAGDDTYDAVQTFIEQLSAMVLGGMFVDLNKVNYIDFSQPWWEASIIQDMSLSNKIFYATGDICLNDDKASWCVLFNKQISSNLNMPDMYQMVRDGKWTLDELKKYASMAVNDVNGDGVMTLDDDVWGIYDELECAGALFLSSGLKTVKKDANDELVYNLDSEEAVNVFEKIYDFMSDTSFQYIVDKHEMEDPWNTIRRHYRANGALFFFTNVGALTMIRDMETDFGVLPVPKLSEEQDRYYNTFQYNNGSAYAVPKSATDTDRTGIILESMAMGSPDTLTPAYFSSTLEQKAVRDNESIEMLKLIFSSRIFDFSLAYAKIGTMNFLKSQAGSETNNYASAEAEKHDVIKAAMDDVMATISKIE